MKPYYNTLSELYSININKGMKLGLENITRLNLLLGLPSAKFPSIHIAGTNGKGSVASKIAKGLESKYPRVGVFTSPHISSFRERITINQQLISEENVHDRLVRIIRLAQKEKIPATFFEVTTLLAFTYFAEQKVDIAVIETGLGGRLDATNIVTPLLSIITSIDYDHTDLLGCSLESIAAEKAGIIKKGVPVILGPTAMIVPVKEKSQTITVKGPFADVESENRAIARSAMEYLNIPEKAIKKALTTRLPCRREKIIFQNKDVILDVAHNPRGLKSLFHDLKIPPKKLRIICGLSKTKDLGNCLEILHQNANDIHLVDASNGRCATPESLQKILLSQNVTPSRITTHHTVENSMSTACSLANAHNQEIIVCGTFFIMSEARKFLGINEPRDPIDLNDHIIPI